MTNIPTHDEPSHWLWRMAGSSVSLFYLRAYISMVTSNSIFNTISYDRKDLYNFTHTKTLILPLISKKISGLEKRDEPTPLFPTTTSWHKNTFRIICSCVRGTTDHHNRLILLTKSHQCRVFLLFLLLTGTNSQVIWDAMTLRWRPKCHFYTHFPSPPPFL